MLWHIAERALWVSDAGAADYAAASLARDGFIHLSTEAQWRGSLRRFYAGRDRRELVLLEIDPAQLPAGVLRWEPADGALFPHLYAALPRAAVVRWVELADAATDSEADARASSR